VEQDQRPGRAAAGWPGPPPDPVRPAGGADEPAGAGGDAPTAEQVADAVAGRVTDELVERLAPRVAELVLARVAEQVSAATSAAVLVGVADLLHASAAASERRVLAHVDEAVVALAEALPRRRRPAPAPPAPDDRADLAVAGLAGDARPLEGDDPRREGSAPPLEGAVPEQPADDGRLLPEAADVLATGDIASVADEPDLAEAGLAEAGLQDEPVQEQDVDPAGVAALELPGGGSALDGAGVAEPAGVGSDEADVPEPAGTGSDGADVLEPASRGSDEADRAEPVGGDVTALDEAGVADVAGTAQDLDGEGLPAEDALASAPDLTHSGHGEPDLAGAHLDTGAGPEPALPDEVVASGPEASPAEPATGEALHAEPDGPPADGDDPAGSASPPDAAPPTGRERSRSPYGRGRPVRASGRRRAGQDDHLAVQAHRAGSGDPAGPGPGAPVEDERAPGKPADPEVEVPQRAAAPAALPGGGPVDDQTVPAGLPPADEDGGPRRPWWRPGG